MDDYEHSDEACPACGHEPTHWQRCSVIGCDDGLIDLYEYEDSINYSPGEYEGCDVCNGTGIEKWCPACGHDLNRPAPKAKAKGD